MSSDGAFGTAAGSANVFARHTYATEFDPASSFFDEVDYVDPGGRWPETPSASDPDAPPARCQMLVFTFDLTSIDSQFTGDVFVFYSLQDESLADSSGIVAYAPARTSAQAVVLETRRVHTWRRNGHAAAYRGNALHVTRAVRQALELEADSLELVIYTALPLQLSATQPAPTIQLGDADQFDLPVDDPPAPADGPAPRGGARGCRSCSDSDGNGTIHIQVCGPTEHCCGSNSTYTVHASGSNDERRLLDIELWEDDILVDDLMASVNVWVGPGQINETLTVTTDVCAFESSSQTSAEVFGRFELHEPVLNKTCETSNILVLLQRQLPAPTGVVATDGVYCNKIRVTWNAVSGATRYNIYRSTTNSACTNLLTTRSASPFDDLSITGGQTYYYSVKAVGPCGDSPCSNVDSGRASGVPSAPNTPTASPSPACAGQGVTLSVSGGFGGTLTWYTGGCGSGSSIGAGSSIAIIAPSSPTTYYVRRESSCGNSSCASAILTVLEPTTWYRDADGDGFGDATASVQDCNQPAGFVADNTDCDDSDPAINPGAADLCGIDLNCDGLAPQPQTWYRDADGDGFGDATASVQDCNQPAGFVADNTDCDDTDPAVNPGAMDLCGIDLNCDGMAPQPQPWIRDADGDGFGSPQDAVRDCDQPDGFVSGDADSLADCDDGDATVYPGAPEPCDGIDHNCNGAANLDGPAIAQEPAGAQIDQSQDASFQVVAIGEGVLSYQWMRNGAPIAGTNSPSFVVSRALLRDAGSYTCAVSNHCGITTTMAASLEVTARLNATVGEAGSAAGIIPGSDPPSGGNPPPPAIFFEVSGGQPGVAIETTVTAGASLVNFNGFFNEQALPRRAEIRTHMEGGAYAILVVMGYSEADLDGIGEGALCLHVYDETRQTWTPAGSQFAGDGLPPVGPSADLVGTHGIDTASNRAWAVLDRDGAFAIGVPEPPGGTDPPGGGNPPPPCQFGLCGICLLPLLAMLGGLFAMKLNLNRGRRRR